MIFGIIGAKKHIFLNKHCHGIISKFKHFLEHKFIKFSKYGVFSTEKKLNLGSMFLQCVVQRCEQLIWTADGRDKHNLGILA